MSQLPLINVPVPASLSAVGYVGPTLFSLLSKLVVAHTWLIGFLVITAFALSSCEEKKLDSPSQGEITVAADESYQPLTEEITNTYRLLYPRTKFNLVFKPEREAISLMLEDKARICIVSRKLTVNEQRGLDQRKIVGSATRIATDGVALLVNKANTDSLMTMSELRGVFTRQFTRWPQLSGGNQPGPITLVFDNPNSSNLDYMLTKFGIKELTGLRIFTTGSNRSVIDYVRQHPEAIGFIGVNWISDGDRPLSAELSRDIRVVGLSEQDKPRSRADYYQPFQQALGLKDYPLRRDVYILSREAHPGLGGGLTNYLIRDAGSLLIEKLGLWPQVPYNREVRFR